MRESQKYPWKCPKCGKSGLYIAREAVVAFEFRCPHDGVKLIWQTPVTPMVVIEETEVYAPIVPDEFTHQLSDAVVRKLKIAGARL